MTEVSGFISEGAIAFLVKEYQYMAVYVVVFSVLLMAVGMGTVISFVVGSITSILSGYVGMKIAVYTNVRTAHEAWKDLSSGVLALWGLIKGFNAQKEQFGSSAELYDAIA